MKINKLILAGGTGFLGQAIIERFSKQQREIIVFTRGGNRKVGNTSYVQWDGKTFGEWTKELEDADVLINLTGKSVDCRYNEKNKADLTRCAENILLAREHHFPATIADLYDPEKMPEDLLHAHEQNDEVVERIYIGRRFSNNTERLEVLFTLYSHNNKHR